MENVVNKKMEEIERIKRERESIESNVQKLLEHDSVRKYLAFLQHLEQDELLLNRLSITRYSEEADCFYEPIQYALLPQYIEKMYPANYQAKIVVTEETFLKRMLLIAQKNRFVSLSRESLEELRGIVLEELQKDKVYEDEPFSQLTDTIRIYLDPKTHEVECLRNQEKESLPVVKYESIIIGSDGNYMFTPALDIEKMEENYGIESIKTQREKEAFTSLKVNEFFKPNKDKKTSYQKVKRI